MGQWMGVSRLSSDGVDDDVELENAEDATVLVAEVADVMVRPLVLHDLLKPHLHLQQLNLFPTLSDWPPTQLGHQPPTHSLSQTLVCFYYLSLLDTLDYPCLHFDP